MEERKQRLIMTEHEMKFLKIGNVIRLPYAGVVIVSEVNSETVNWVSLDSSNCSGVLPYKTESKQVECGCRSLSLNYQPDPECEDCDGEGYVMEKRLSLEDATKVADNVKAHIKWNIGITNLFK